jgi:hypothetical protein
MNLKSKSNCTGIRYDNVNVKITTVEYKKT